MATKSKKAPKNAAKPAASPKNAPKAEKVSPPLVHPAALVPTETYPVLIVDPKIVHISQHNTRQPKPETCQELIASIAKGGQLTAAIVRPHPTRKGEYELAAGARRKTATEALGLKIKIEVRPLSDDQLLDFILVENLQREDPDPFAEAALIKKRLAEGVTADEVAGIYGKDARWVTRRMKLNSIIPAILTRLTKGDMQHYTLPMAELLGTLPPDIQKDLNQESWTLSNCNSFSRLADHIAAESATLTPAVVKAFANPETHLKACGPNGCSTASDSTLFPELTGTTKGGNCAKCLNTTCFTKRLTLVETAAITALTSKAGLKYTKLLFWASTYTRRKSISLGGQDHSIQDRWDMERAYAFHNKPYGETIAIDVADPVAPKLQWIAPKPGVSASGKAGPTPAEKARAAIKKAAKADGEKLSEEEVTAAVRRQNHQRKRWKLVHENLCTALEKSKAPDLTTSQWLMLFAAFGSDLKRCFLSGHNSGHGQKEIWSLAASSPPDDIDRAAHTKFYNNLWTDHFYEVLQARLKFFNGMENFDETALLRIEMAHVAKLVSFDLTAAKKAADLQLPPPKSLGRVDVHTLLPLT